MLKPLLLVVSLLLACTAASRLPRSSNVSAMAASGQPAARRRPEAVAAGGARAQRLCPHKLWRQATARDRLDGGGDSGAAGTPMSGTATWSAGVRIRFSTSGASQRGRGRRPPFGVPTMARPTPGVLSLCASAPPANEFHVLQWCFEVLRRAEGRQPLQGTAASGSDCPQAPTVAGNHPFLRLSL